MTGLKSCTDCHQWKPFNEFYANKPMPDGRLKQCIVCTLAKRKLRQKAAPLAYKVCTVCKVNKPASEYHGGTSAGGLYPKCIPCRFEARRKPLDECKWNRHKEAADGTLHCSRCRLWLPKTKFWKCAANKTGYALMCKGCSRLDFRQRYAAGGNFKEQVAVTGRARRAATLMQTPPWADRKAIIAVYRKAYRLRKATGEPWTVDHDIPLRGKLVSGLHIAENLVIMLSTDNSRKNNHFSVV